MQQSRVSRDKVHMVPQCEKPCLRGFEQQWRTPACASAQSNQRLCYSLIRKSNTLATSEISFFLISVAEQDCFESHFIGNPEYKICRCIEDHMILFYRHVVNR